MKAAIGIAVIGVVALVAVVSMSQLPAGEKASEPYLRISCAEGKPSGVPCKDKPEETEATEANAKNVTDDREA